MLTDKQQRFIEEYIIDLNATQAYLRAGYKVSEEVAAVNANRLLRNAKVKNEIDKRLAEKANKCSMKAEEVIKELESIAKDDIKNYLSFKTEKVFVGYDSDGKPVSDYRTIVNMKDSDEIDTRNISEISIGKDGQFKFKLYCRDNALVQLGKHHKLFTDKIEAEVTSQVVIIGEDKLED